MATPPPDNIADDFFDQLFSNSSIPLQLASGEPAAGGGGFPPGPLFPLSLSLDQGNGGLPNSDNASGTAMHDAARAPLGSLFPAFGQVQQHQVRPDHAASQVFHGQMGQGGVGAGQQQHQAPRPRLRARRGQATDPHSIAERTDKAAMLDEVLDYVKFLRLQVKVLSMSRLGGTGAVAQLVADIPLSSLEEEAYEGGSKQQVWEKWSTDGTERQVAKLMDEDVGAAMQFLQSKALCIMPISLATAIYHTHQNSGSPSIKHEPNTPS